MKDPSGRLVLLYSREQIARRVRELAASISADYAGSDLVLIGILRGAFVFLADLIRHLTIPVIVDFIGAASYGSQRASGSSLRATDFAGRGYRGHRSHSPGDSAQTQGTRASVHQSLHPDRQARTAAC